MNDREQAIVICGAITATQALCVVASLTGDTDAQVAADVIYPYYCFDADCSVPTLAGRKQVSLVCLVDAINGLGATADSFALKKESVSADAILAAELDNAAAAEVAQRTITHRLGRRLRTITSFEVVVRPRGIVHKRFWIVQSSAARVMVDSMTGRLHPLKLRAA